MVVLWAYYDVTYNCVSRPNEWITYNGPLCIVECMGAGTGWAGWASADPENNLGGRCPTWISLFGNSLNENCPPWYIVQKQYS